MLFINEAIESAYSLNCRKSTLGEIGKCPWIDIGFEACRALEEVIQKMKRDEKV